MGILYMVVNCNIILYIVKMHNTMFGIKKYVAVIDRSQEYTKEFRYVVAYGGKGLCSAFYWCYDISNKMRLLHIIQMDYIRVSVVI